MRDFDTIRAIVTARQAADSPLISKLIDMRNRYNGDIVLPMPDVPEQSIMPNVSPHLIAEAIDVTAMRAASVIPIIESMPVDMGKQTGKGSRDFALRRTRAVGASLGMSGFLLGRRRYYRHLSGYATCALVVYPHPRGHPCVEVRDPLSAYPDPQPPELVDPPANCAFLTQRSAGAIRSQFPQARVELGGPIAEVPEGMNEMWTLVEWIDADDWVIGLMGPTWDAAKVSVAEHRKGDPWMLLEVYQNKAAMPVAFVPRRVTMDKIASQVANLVGQIDIMNKLIALDIIAQEKAIFPDRYVLSDMGQQARILGGGWSDGREGKTNMIEGAKAIGELRSTPDMRTRQLTDSLERNFRISTGLTPQAGGETYGNLRTGRAIDTSQGAAVDMRIQELHEITQQFMPGLCEAITRTYLGWWPSKKFSLVSRWDGARARVDFTPETHLAEAPADYIVYYPITGADITGTTVGIAQARAAKLISQRTARRMHPWIQDGYDEERLINEEDLESGMMATLLMKIQQGEVPPIAAAMLEEHVRAGLDIFEAFKLMDAEMRKMQAAEPAPPAPGELMPPEMAPGMEGPAGPMGPPPGPGGPMGAGMPGMPPEVAGPNPSQENIRSLLLATKAQGAPRPVG